MTDDARMRSPLADRAADLSTIAAREVAFLAQVSLRLEARVAQGPHPILPPTAPNTWATVEGRELLWLGPDEWLVIGDRGRADDVVAWLDEAFAPLHRSIVDVSANRAVLELDGPDRGVLLSSGCGLDLDPRAWRNGQSAQTLVGRVPVVLQERASSTRVFVRPSLAGSLVDWMLAVRPR